MTRMKSIGCVLVFLIFLHCIRSAAGGYCQESYSCQGTCYRTERTKVLCLEFWNGFQCTEYSSKPYICDSTCYRQVCCEGWTGSHCSTPLCNGKTSCNNGGTCTSPNTCHCQRGYDQPDCDDNNECAVVNGGCSEICNNVPGSYTCSCRNGYTLDSDLKGCIDINECGLSNGSCQELCVNTDGSYRCDCPTGFTLNTDGKTCKDMDECTNGIHTCQHGCDNTIGSYTCNCNPGYSLALDHKTCEDVDECVSAIPVCDQQCHNTDGLYYCSCDEGYTLHNDDTTCDDNDECLQDNGNCSGTCTNTQGSYTCSCPSGYRLQNDRLTCEGIDECTDVTSGCSDMCMNTAGSFVCSCPAGTHLDDDNSTCIDIDDCDGVKCEHGATCIDGYSSYNCACTRGFTGDHCQSDIDECNLLNGGCQDLCQNTFGSYHCSCSENRTLSSNGVNCLGISTTASVFQKYNITGQGLPKGCWILKWTGCQNGETLDLLSTSPWYTPNEDLHFTFGIVFAEVNIMIIPISLNGVEIHGKPNNFQLKQGVSTVSVSETVVGNRRIEKCIDANFSANEMFEFIDSGSFLISLFDTLKESLPNWIDFRSSDTSHMKVQDSQTELLYGHQIKGDPLCGTAPVFLNHLYSVSKFEADFLLDVYGKPIHITKTYNGRKICIIVDICQAHGPAVFLINPHKDSNVVSNFGALFKNVIDVKAQSIGISLADGINFETSSSSKTDVQMWNGEHLFSYPTSHRGNLWLNGDFRIDSGLFDIRGEADMFFTMPNIRNVLFSGFHDVTTAFISQRSLVLVLKLNILGDHFEIPLGNFVASRTDIYMSLGESDERLFCGTRANPTGIFTTTSLSINPFLNVPVLKDFVFDNTHKAYLYLENSQKLNQEQFSFSSALHGISNVKQRLYDFKYLLVNILGEVEGIATDQLKSHIQDITHLISTLIEVIEAGLLNIVDKDVGEILVFSSDIWRSIKHIQTETYSFLDTEELFVDVRSDSIVFPIRTGIRNIAFSFESLVHAINDQISESVDTFDGYGIKYHANLKVFGLELIDLDIEMVYSNRNVFACSRFKMINQLFEEKEAVRFLARVSKEVNLGKFLKLIPEFEIGMAFATKTYDILLQFPVPLKILGTRANAKVILTRNRLTIYTQLNIWELFTAQIDISAELGKNWYELVLNIHGRFIPTTEITDQAIKNGETFQYSYLNALIKSVQLLTDEINKRLSQAQDILRMTKYGFTKAQNWLSDKKESLKKAHVLFDNAQVDLQQAQDKVEEAKGPYLHALEKLEKAKINVDNLCKIKSCDKICIPGIKCKPGCFILCCKFTKCMFTIPDPTCLIKNLFCRAVRAAAYLALDVAKLIVHTVLLSFDLAKAALELAKFVVDKARIVIDVSTGLVTLAEHAVVASKKFLDAAIFTLDAIKKILGYAVQIAKFVVENGLKNIIDIRNCGFDIEVSTDDLPVFGVNCEINAFRNGWKAIHIRINFKNVIQSLWQAAKATIKAIINDFASVLGRRRRSEIEFETSAMMHKILRNSRSLENEDILDTLQYDDGFKNNATSDYGQRVELFLSKCTTISNVLSFLNESFATLLEMANETHTTIKESLNVRSDLQTYNLSTLSGNISLETSDISPYYAFIDYNITKSDLEDIISKAKDELISDPLLQVFNSTINVASDFDTEISAAITVQTINQWLLVMENTTSRFFNTSQCNGFHDCVRYAFYLLYDIYIEENLPDIDLIKHRISSLENEITEIFQNNATTIEEIYISSKIIKTDIMYLVDTNLFCSRPPVFLDMNTNQSIYTGSRVSIHCNVDADPLPTFIWFKDDQNLPGYTEETFIVESAAVDDEGVYRCVAGNVVANITSMDIYLFIIDIRTENVDVVKNENDGDTMSTMYIPLIMVSCAIVLVISSITIFISYMRIRKSVQVNPQGDETSGIAGIDMGMNRVTEVTEVSI